MYTKRIEPKDGGWNLNKSYYLAFEGEKTELKYFLSLNRSKVFSSMVTIIPMLKGITERSNSNPKTVVKMVSDYVDYQQDKGCSTEFFLSMVFTCLNQSRQHLFNPHDPTIKKLKGELKIELQSQKAANQDYIIDIDSATSIATGFFERKLNREIKLDLDRFRDSICRDSTDAEYYIIVDRDIGSFTEQQVEEVIKSCNENGYNLVITNPCFELWLLLHFDIPHDRIMECVEKNTLKKELSKYSDINDSSKNRYVYEEFPPTAGVARMKLNRYSQDLMKVKKPTNSGNDAIGSNIGSLMDELTRRPCL